MTFPEHRAHLRELVAELGRQAPGPMSGFARLHASSVTDGELEPKVKELMALAIAIAIHCEDCIAYHVHDALAAGATRQEILETIGVAITMGGGPAAVYGARALEAAGQFDAARRHPQSAAPGMWQSPDARPPRSRQHAGRHGGDPDP